MNPPNELNVITLKLGGIVFIALLLILFTRLSILYASEAYLLRPTRWGVWPIAQLRQIKHLQPTNFAFLGYRLWKLVLLTEKGRQKKVWFIPRKKGDAFAIFQDRVQKANSSLSQG